MSEILVLVIGNDAELAAAAADRLDGYGLRCRRADNPVGAIGTLEQDPGVKLVLLQSNESELSRTIRAILRVRPNVVIVGLGVPERDAEYKAAGGAGCLPLRWDRDELLALLTRKILSCVGCGIDLPLRSAAPFESLQRFACRFCGERYAGVMRDDASAEARSNVRTLSDAPGRI